MHRLRSMIVLACLTVLAGACSTPPAAPVASTAHAPETSGFLNEVLVSADQAYRYVLYVPHDYTPDTAWPLVVFLHGAGERGNDGLIQTEVGIGTAIRRYQDRFPALVLFPQCPEDRFWDSVLPQVEEAMDRTKANYSIDPARIYLTGVSMGGYATWMWGAVKRDTFAALLPICAGGQLADIKLAMKVERPEIFLPFEEQVNALAALPIYAYHGEEDEVVPVTRSRETVDLVRAAGGDVKYKTLKDVGHECWDEVYGNKRAVEWLFEQRKTPSAAVASAQAR
ncbi:MAG: dienelactone hydrolase family protein [Candidatus Hydrogenedentes bacterium]|nr:dienelactone hydrolase family protein [Candidatus Hydrogenedentota bacterium]